MDVVIPTGVSKLVAEQIGAIVAPTLNYGFKSVPCMGGGPYIGTVGLDASTLVEQLRDIVRELVRHGVRRIVLLCVCFLAALPCPDA